MQVAAEDAAVTALAAHHRAAAVGAAVAVRPLDHSSSGHLCLQDASDETVVLIWWHYHKNDCSKSSVSSNKIEQKD
jgi:hypothetical protein